MRRSFLFPGYVWFAAWSLAASAAAGQAADQFQDQIDPSVRYQTIQYFAASDCWSMQEIGGWALPNRNRIADLLFSQEKGIGLSAWRFNLGGGIERTRIRNAWRTSESFEISAGRYDWSRCVNQRWFLAAANERGVPNFIAFCNSPPMRLTRNGLTSLDPKADQITNNLQPGKEREFGTYLADILAHFRDNPQKAERINFKWISPINEPQWDWTGGQEGTRADNDDIVAQYKAIAAALESHHLTTHLLGPESGSIPDMYQRDGTATGKHKAPYGDYVDALCGNPDLASAMDYTIAYHSYWSDNPNELQQHRRQLRKKLDQYPQWQPAESEYCVMESKRDLTMATAIRVLRVVHADLTIVNSVAWSWWTAVSNGNYKDGLIYTDWRRPGDTENILPSKLLWALGNFSRFVRPGMIRVELSARGEPHDINGFMGSAYVDPTTGRLVAVYINGKDATATVELSVARAGGMKWTPYVTSDKDGDDLKEYPSVDGGQPISIPSRSVVTLVGTR